MLKESEVFMIECENGAFGSIEATRNAWGRNNYITFEIHGTLGSLYFNYERRDELQVCFASDPDDRRADRRGTAQGRDRLQGIHLHRSDERGRQALRDRVQCPHGRSRNRGRVSAYRVGPDRFVRGDRFRPARPA